MRSCRFLYLPDRSCDNLFRYDDEPEIACIPVDEKDLEFMC